jgi:hypothetical protein
MDVGMDKAVEQDSIAVSVLYDALGYVTIEGCRLAITDFVTQVDMILKDHNCEPLKVIKYEENTGIAVIASKHDVLCMSIFGKSFYIKARSTESYHPGMHEDRDSLFLEDLEKSFNMSLEDCPMHLTSESQLIRSVCKHRLSEMV